MESSPQVRILLVEDDVKLANLVAEYLGNNNFAISIEHQGDQAPTRILKEKPDLVILDILLPGKDGRTICREVRKEYSGIILMLTALDDELEEVAGLDIGADDYIRKPVRPRLLLSRINAFLRRSKVSDTLVPNEADREPAITTSKIVIGPIEVDAANRSVTANGVPLDLTTAEFDLLYYLAGHSGEVLSRNRIYREVRGIDYDNLDRSIDLRIARLRKKLGDDSKHPQIIKSIRGEGYLMVKEP